MNRPLFRARTIWLKTITVAIVSIGVISIGSSVPAFAGVALSPGETIYAGETVTINEPPNAPPWLGSGSVYIAIDTGKFGAGSHVENVQGTENGNSVTFTVPANLTLSSGTPVYFLVNDILFPYFTPNYRWGVGSPGTVLSPGETIYAGEAVTINKPSGSPPWVGSGSVYIAIDTGKSGAGSYVEDVQGTENGNSVTFTVPAKLTLSSGTPVYFLVNDILFPYFTPNYRWGVGSPPTVLSPGETIYAGETVTIDNPSGSPPWLGSGSIYIAIDTGRSGAGSYVENVQGTENGNSVTFTLPANLSVSSGTPMYFLINDPLFPYFTPNYTWGGGPPTGNLPEVPFAGTLPVMGLGGLVIVAYIRRRRRAL